MIQGVNFDMDGLMFDTERIWNICWEPALAKFGLPYKDGLSQAARGTTKAGSCDVLRRFYGEDCPAMGIVEELYRLAYDAFNKPVPKMPGLDELLAWLDEHHIPMAVASSSPMTVIEGHLEHWGLGHYFKAVISGEQLTRSKPAPDIILLAASRPPPTRCAGSIPASVRRSTRCAEILKTENYEPRQTRTTREISTYHLTNINKPRHNSA